MSTHLEKGCDWCEQRIKLDWPSNSSGAVYPNQIVRKLPARWTRMRNPIKSTEDIEVCAKCKDAIDGAIGKAEEARKQVLLDSMPRGPRLERDDKMREKERQRAADGL